MTGNTGETTTIVNSLSLRSSKEMPRIDSITSACTPPPAIGREAEEEEGTAPVEREGNTASTVMLMIASPT